IRLESARDAVPRAVELERPAGELPAERGRLRVNAMRAADANGVPVLLRSCDDCRERAVDPFEDLTPGILNLQRQRRVHDVGRREPVVEPASLRAQLLRDG